MSVQYIFKKERDSSSQRVVAVYGVVYVTSCKCVVCWESFFIDWDSFPLVTMRLIFPSIWRETVPNQARVRFHICRLWRCSKGVIIVNLSTPVQAVPCRTHLYRLWRWTQWVRDDSLGRGCDGRGFLFQPVFPTKTIISWQRWEETFFTRLDHNGVLGEVDITFDL